MVLALLFLTSLLVHNVSADGVWTNKTVYQVGEIVIIYFDASSYASNAGLMLEGPYSLYASLAGLSPGSHSWRMQAESRDVGRWRVTFTPGCEPSHLCFPAFYSTSFLVVEPETTITTTAKSSTRTTTTRSSAVSLTGTTAASYSTAAGTFLPLESSQPSILQSPFFMPALIGTWFAGVLAYAAYRVNLVNRRGPSPRTTRLRISRLASVEPGTNQAQPYITPGVELGRAVIEPGRTMSISPGERLGTSQPRPLIPAIPLPIPRRSKVCGNCGRSIPRKSPYCPTCGIKQD